MKDNPEFLLKTLVDLFWVDSTGDLVWPYREDFPVRNILVGNDRESIHDALLEWRRKDGGWIDELVK